MPLAPGTRCVSIIFATSHSTLVRPALSLFSQRKPVCSGTQQRGCQAAGRRLVYPVGPKEALALRPGSEGCWEEWHLTQGGGSRQVREPEAPQPSPGREVTEQAVAVRPM